MDETDVGVAVGAAEPEFKAEEAAQQANGDEAYSFWDRFVCAALVWRCARMAASGPLVWFAHICLKCIACVC